MEILVRKAPPTLGGKRVEACVGGSFQTEAKVMCDDSDPHYLQRFIRSNIRDPIRDSWWAPGLPVGSFHSPLFY